jgi:transposase InsO family protein
VRRFRKAHPTWGTRRLVHELRRYFPTLRRAVVRHILRVAQLQHPGPRRRPRRRCPIPVGRHRVQMDIQTLPAITGGGYEYKISVIHLRTRMKHSEIHRNHRSRTVADVLHRALDLLPPVHLVWTDNAFEFTMRFSAHPERTTAFQQRVMALDLQHGTCRPRSPWQNGIVERSHRTDNEECFHALTFRDNEERRYQHRLYEMHYNTQRPHQGLNGDTPFAVYQREYPVHATTRMLGAPPVNMAKRGST